MNYAEKRAELVQSLDRRCLAAGLELRDAFDDESNSGGYVICDPVSIRTWSLALVGGDAEETVLATRFEDYRPLPKYDGMWSSANRTIECELLQAGNLVQEN